MLNFTLPDASIHDIYGTSITETTIKFINDIIEVCMENNLYAIIKDKDYHMPVIKPIQNI